MIDEIENLIDEWASYKFGTGSPGYSKAKSEWLDKISRLLGQPINYEIDEIGIAVCRDGKQKGSMMAFYKNREDALSDQNRVFTIEFGTLEMALRWSQMNHQMMRTIHSALN